jgi:hypothetical protein
VPDLPEPLTPADCDLQDFEFMPVMVRRLLRSDTWVLANGEERAAAVALWFESWHQVPAASLPDNDKLLRKLADSEKWIRVKAQALRGWVQCSDGRLYHPVVAEKALEAWIEKLLNSISGSAGNAKRWGVSIDTRADVDRLGTAVAMLRALSPKSKSLNKKALLTIIAPQSPPDAVNGRIGGGGGESGGESGGDTPSDRKGQGQGQGSSSVPKGTGGEPPKSPAEREKSSLWAALKAKLVEQSTCGDLKEAGVLLGKAAKQYGEPVFLDAARTTLAKDPAPGNAHTYFIELCEVAAGKRRPLSRHSGFDEKDYRKGITADGHLT